MHPVTQAVVEEYAAWYDRDLDPACFPAGTGGRLAFGPSDKAAYDRMPVVIAKQATARPVGLSVRCRIFSSGTSMRSPAVVIQ